MLRTPLLWVFLSLSLLLSAQTHISIANPQTWTNASLAPYVGQTVIFDEPVFITANYSGYSVSPRRIFSPTNQALPLSAEYNYLLTHNGGAIMTISGLSNYHRLGERIVGLKAKVNSTSSLTFLDGTFVGNTRNDLLKGYDREAIDARGEHTLLVCGFNLEYYLVEQYSSPGPRNDSQHQQQRAKVSKALAAINADIYGLVEIQQGHGALQEIVSDLHKNTGRNYDYITLTTSASGTFTQSAYVYCTDVVAPDGTCKKNSVGVANRKALQAFKELATGERFIFSINHFKAKSGSGTGSDADKGDGQGSYNGTRVREAQSVITDYSSYRYTVDEYDILIMGDLNAYAKENPITTLTSVGLMDLHRAFHADSSYSYAYRSGQNYCELGYLDHALCNATLYPQITGMCNYPINSDESDRYTYDSSSDETMFRSSDHDPVLVGLRLDSHAAERLKVQVNALEVMTEGSQIVILNAQLDAAMPAFYRLYHSNGMLMAEGQIAAGDNNFVVPRPAYSGVYVVQIFSGGKSYQKKIIVY